MDPRLSYQALAYNLVDLLTRAHMLLYTRITESAVDLIRKAEGHPDTLQSRTTGQAEAYLEKDDYDPDDFVDDEVIEAAGVPVIPTPEQRKLV